MEKINQHARSSYPEECCGVLMGRVSAEEKTVEDVAAIDNARSEERNRRFLITPDDYIRAEKDAKSKSLDILGFYHSHPDHPARPSQYDFDHAWPWFSYLIVSVEKGEPSVASSWVVDDEGGAFIEESIDILDEEF
jgi:proteasome lid subunit RPN8/RPN11